MDGFTLFATGGVLMLVGGLAYPPPSAYPERHKKDEDTGLNAAAILAGFSLLVIWGAGDKETALAFFAFMAALAVVFFRSSDVEQTAEVAQMERKERMERRRGQAETAVGLGAAFWAYGLIRWIFLS